MTINTFLNYVNKIQSLMIKLITNNSNLQLNRYNADEIFKDACEFVASKLQHTEGDMLFQGRSFIPRVEAIMKVQNKNFDTNIRARKSVMESLIVNARDFDNDNNNLEAQYLADILKIQHLESPALIHLVKELKAESKQPFATYRNLPDVLNEVGSIVLDSLDYVNLFLSTPTIAIEQQGENSPVNTNAVSINLPLLKTLSADTALTGPMFDYSKCISLEVISLLDCTFDNSNLPQLKNFKNLNSFSLNSCSLIGRVPSIDDMDSLEYLMLADNALSEFDTISTPKNLKEIHLQSNNFTTAIVDKILASCAKNLSTKIDCVLRLEDNAAPSATGLAQKALLIAAGWTVTTD